MNDNKSLAHTKWNCKYHIVFAPKFRRKSSLRRDKRRYRENTKRVVQMERDRNNSSGDMPRPHTYVYRNPT